MSRFGSREQFVHANGVHLHYLDWGGLGPVLLFLTGLGRSAHYYSHFASLFAGKHRVIALTRRGHGESDCPTGGYDVRTLVEDVRQVLDALKIERAVLVGHSLANVELGGMATQYPERVLGMVYLDAAYDGPGYKLIAEKDPLKNVSHPQEDAPTIADYVRQLRAARPDLDEIWCQSLEEDIPHLTKATPNGKVITRMPDAVAKALIDTYCAYSPPFAGVQLPMLGIFAIRDGYADYVPHYLTPEQARLKAEYSLSIDVPYQRGAIRAFRQAAPHAKVVEIPHGHHYCFIKHETIVSAAIRDFLLQVL